MSGTLSQGPPDSERDDPLTRARALRLRQLMNRAIADQTPQDRDRMMQVHLAQARGPEANAVALRRLMDFAIRLGRLRRNAEADHDR